MPLNSINLSGPVISPTFGFSEAADGGITRYVYQDSSGNGVASLDQLPAGMQDIADNTVALALAKCRDNRGDNIIVLPGHVETIGANAWSLKKGVTIACMGNDSDRPTFNWTAATSQIAFNKAGVRVMNAIFNFAVTAATEITKACAVTAQTTFEGCLVTLATSATVGCTVGFELATGADRTKFDGCTMTGTANGAVQVINIVNAIDSPTIKRSTIIAGTSATTMGVVNLTAAATNCMFDDCSFANLITNSTVAVNGFAACTGMLTYLNLGITNATGGATAIAVPGNWNMNQCFGGVIAKNGIAITPQSG